MSRQTTRILLAAILLFPVALMAQETEEKVAIGDPETPYYQTDMSVRKSPKGMIILGADSCVRVFQPFTGSSAAALEWADILNKYCEQLRGKIKMYSMILPEAAAYYTPEAAAEWSRPVKPAIQRVYDALDSDISSVDAYSALLPHTQEPIYLRTDHHWAPLGAYYAAQAFARVAEVPFLDITHFDTDTVHNFVGTMNRYSGNNACINAPEDFVYYIPKNTNLMAQYIKYRLKNRKAVGENPPVTENFFVKYPDGSGAAYCTFMGGDSRTVKIDGMVSNGRRLLLTKDSFGNALPAFLLNSFEQIHIIDPRYYSKGILTYIDQNEITDWLVCNCVTFVYTNVTSNNLEKLFK